LTHLYFPHICTAFAKNDNFGGEAMLGNNTGATRFIYHRGGTCWRVILLLSLLALAALNLPAFLLAQNPARGIKFERLGMEQGLSQPAIYCTLQDRQGFMWFGTQEGLNKFTAMALPIHGRRHSCRSGGRGGNGEQVIFSFAQR
jgi:hypothetical protein